MTTNHSIASQRKPIQIVHAVELFDYISPEHAPKACNGLHVHNQSLWREFFVTLELLQNQCLSCGRDLVAVMNEIRLSDGQGAPSRRQLYSQHRALSRALMDSELQCLRRKGQQTITRLQSLSKSISNTDAAGELRRRNDGDGNVTRQFSKNTNGQMATTPATKQNPCEHVTHRLNATMAIFVEVDRAARRLEQLTEQRRERLREITRQQALEDEMNEVIFSMLHVTILIFPFWQKPFSSSINRLDGSHSVCNDSLSVE